MMSCSGPIFSHSIPVSQRNHRRPVTCHSFVADLSSARYCQHSNYTMVAFVRTGVKCDDAVSAELRAKIRNDAVSGPKADQRVSKPTTTDSAAPSKAPRKRPIFLDDPSESHHNDDAGDFNRMNFGDARQNSNASFQKLLAFRSSDEEPSTSACSTDSSPAEHRKGSKKNRNYDSRPRLSLPRVRMPNFERLTEGVRNFWSDLDCRRSQGGGVDRRMMADHSDSRW